MKLTADFVRADDLAVGTYWETEDKKLVGFGLRVYAGGGKSFFLNYRNAGHERRVTIGPFPRWTLAAARERAYELRRLIDTGRDPAVDKRERLSAPTVQDLIHRYVRDHLPKKRDGNGWRVVDEHRQLDEIARRLGKYTKVADVHGGDIVAMHAAITESGRPVRANRILTTCSTMFSLSLMPLAGENQPWRNAAQGNPCKGVKRNHEEGKERFYSEAELARIGDALNSYPGSATNCVRLIMLTGCRPGEATKARWSEFDAEPGYWIKPSSHTKQRKVHKLPLSPPALELIERLRSERKDTDWVFPSPNKPGQPLGVLHHVWVHVRKHADIGEDDRLYDLRHSFASIGAAGGLSLPIIGRLLGHTQTSTTQRYAHLADDPLRDAASKITAVITGAGKPGANVVDIKR